MSDKPKLMSTTARIRISAPKFDLMNTAIDKNNREVMTKLFEWLREGESSFMDMGDDSAPLPEIHFELTPERQKWLAERGVFTEEPTQEQLEATMAKSIIPRPLSDDGSGEVSVLRSLGLAMSEAYKKIPENPEHDDNVLRLDAVKKCLQAICSLAVSLTRTAPILNSPAPYRLRFPDFITASRESFPNPIILATPSSLSFC
jgi:hypothetical protein